MISPPEYRGIEWSDVQNKPASFPSSSHTHDYNSLLNAKRIETYLGTTDTDGNYSVVYSTAFASTPDVQPQLQASAPASNSVRITASSNTGFTVNVSNRGAVVLLAVEVLLASTTPVNGASVGVLVIERE